MTEEARPAEALAREAEGAALVDLVMEIRGGSRLSPPELTRLDQVRLLLVADGIPLRDPRAALILAPIVCTSASQQALFLKSFAERFGVPPEALPPKPELPIVESVPLPWWRRQRLRIGLAVAAAISGYWLWTRWPEDLAPPPPDTPTPTQMARILFGGREASALSTAITWWVLLSIAAALLLAMLMAGHRWWGRRRRRKAADAFEPDHFAARDLAVAATFPRLYGSMRLRRRLAGLRRHRIVPSARIHVGRSIAATVRAGGRPVLVFASRPVTPDYVILADRASPRDHLPFLARALTSRLNAEGVGAAVYEYFGDPRLVRSTLPGEEGVELTLDGLAARHEGARVMLLAEASQCLTADGDPAPWLDELPEERVLLDPRLEPGWDWREERLRESGLPVFPASSDGIARYADAVRARDVGGALQVARADWKLDLPTVLHPHRAALVRDTALPEAEVADLLEDLEVWLGPDAMTVFRATAVFPLVERTLTLLLAGRFADSRNAPMLGEERLLAIARLPWMRLGYMPRWLRVPLVRGLAAPDLDLAVRTVHAFLNPVRSGPAKRLKLDFSQADDPAVRRRLLDWLRSNPSSLYSDSLLFDALSGRPPQEIGAEPDPDSDPALIRYLRRIDARRDSIALLATLVLTLSVAFLQPAREQIEKSLPAPVPPTVEPSSEDEEAGPGSLSSALPGNDLQSGLMPRTDQVRNLSRVGADDPALPINRPDWLARQEMMEKALRGEDGQVAEPESGSSAEEPASPIGQTGAAISTQPVLLRSAPSAQGEILMKLVPRDTFTIVGAEGDWLRVRMPDGQQGFIARQFVDLGISPPVPGATVARNPPVDLPGCCGSETFPGDGAVGTPFVIEGGIRAVARLPTPPWPSLAAQFKNLKASYLLVEAVVRSREAGNTREAQDEVKFVKDRLVAAGITEWKISTAVRETPPNPRRAEPDQIDIIVRFYDGGSPVGK